MVNGVLFYGAKVTEGQLAAIMNYGPKRMMRITENGFSKYNEDTYVTYTDTSLVHTTDSDHDEKPYIVGWFSEGSTERNYSFAINMITDEIKANVDRELAKVDLRAEFRIVSYSCDCGDVICRR